MRFNIEKDKLYHIFAGFIITMFFGLLFSMSVGVIVGICAGIAKEVFDYIDYGVFDRKDLFFTSFGSIAAGWLLVAIL